MFKINLHIILFLMVMCLHYGGTVEYNPYATNQQQPYLLHNANNYNDNDNNGFRNPEKQQSAFNEEYYAYQANQNHGQNLPGNSNYPQLYRYYYTPPHHQQQQQQQQQFHNQLQPHQSATQFWSGSPIVVEDDIQQKSEIATDTTTQNYTPTYYQQQQPSTTTSRNSNSFMPSLFRNSKDLPLVYNPSTTPHATQLNYNNNNKINNNNIVYHRDFRHQIDDIPVTAATIKHFTQQDEDDNIVSWNNQQQQQFNQQHSQQQQFYATNINLQRHNGISSNDLRSLSKENVSDYREHFKRYLENNPRRIKPIY